MEYLTCKELVRLFKVARDRNKLHHIAMLVGLLHGLRVSEMLAIRSRDICDGKLSIKRLKKSRATLHTVRVDSDPLFDESPLLELAKANPDTKLFRWSRQYMDIVLKRYAALSGIHPSKAHYHVLKHSIDRVKLVGIPPGVRDKDDMQTRTLFEKCLGQTFVVADVESFDGVPFPLAKLDVGHVVGKQPWEHTIWVEPEYLQVETP